LAAPKCASWWVKISLVNATLLCSGDCELVAPLTYASPTQINFVIPDIPNGVFWEQSPVVLIRDGVRFDARYDILGGPGLLTLDPQYPNTYNDNDSAVFGVGYDCPFSFSLSDPSACGLSWSPGQNRSLLSAVTDVSGHLITFENPVHQGELIILWMGLTRMTVSATTGLLQQAQPGPVGFGVFQNGSDIAETVPFDSFDGSTIGLFPNTTSALCWGVSAIRRTGSNQRQFSDVYGHHKS
jgi:hypothetical protein